MVVGGVEAGGTGDVRGDDVTFLFTDLEGSTAMWEERPEAMRHALEAHDDRVRAAVEARGGYVFTTAGDSFAVAFDSARDALWAAVDAQRALADPCGELALRIRIGLHSGPASMRDGDYFGATVNRCARLMAAAHGGQILVSGTTGDLVSSTPDVDLVDLGEHRLKDLRAPLRILEVRHADLPNAFPPPRTLEGSPSALPWQLTDMVGRSEEIDELQRLLAEHRLVTLTGSAGSGKTRLALQVAAESSEAHPGGTWWVELASIEDPALVIEEIAERVGARPAPDVPILRTVARRIGDVPALLVVDNCEHLIDTVAEIAAALLQSCPKLRLLATSQQSLDLAGEVRFRVPSLALPRGAELVDALESEAVRLFADRAGSVRTGFAVDEENVGAVVSICRRLDGIPLALELAAARVSVLSPAQIAERLDERFRLLGGAGRGVPPRQQTLRAALDWSHALLPEEERAALRRQSVFAGDFTVEAAEAVCEGDPVDSLLVLDLLTRLVDKSMVTPEHGVEATRYRLLESIRAYGFEQLDQAGETAGARARHAAHYVDVAEAIYVLRRSGEMRSAIDAYDQVEDNVRAALRFTLDTGDLESAARLIRSVGHIWYLEGLFREGIDWCTELFDAAPELDDSMLAGVLHVHGTLLGSWNRPAAGVDILRREVDLLRDLDDAGRLAAALNNLGNVLNDLGRSDEAESALGEAIERFRAAEQSFSLALVSLGFGYFQRGRYHEARRTMRQALAAAEAEHDDYTIALSRLHTARCDLLEDGDLDAARAELLACRSSFGDLAVAPAVAECEMLLGHLERTAGNRDAAAAHLLASLQDPDGHWYQSTKFWILQLVAGLVDDGRVARQLATVAAARYRSVDEPQPVWVVEDLRRLRDGLDARAGRDVALDADADAVADVDVDVDAERAIDVARSELQRLIGAC